MTKFGTFSGRSVLALSAMLSLLVAACGSTDSDNVASEGIGATITVEAPGDGTTEVTARLYVGSGGLVNTDLELDSGDRLIASAGSETRGLGKQEDLLGGLSYQTTFAIDAPGSEFIVSFERPAGTDAPDSRATLPQPVIFVLPNPGQNFTLGDDVLLTWQGAAPGGTLDFEYATTCPLTGGTSFNGGRRTIPDLGSFTISSSELVDVGTAQVPLGTQCATELKLTRSATGLLDPNFGEGGRITARQTRSRAIAIAL